MLISLSILGVVFLFSLPTAIYYVENTRADTRIIQLYSTLLFARNMALASDQIVLICPTDDLHQCNGNWSDKLMVFTDQNENQQVDGTDRVLRVLEPNTNGSLKWTAFGSNRYLKFVPYGFSNQQNGTFIYCGPSSKVKMSRGIIISKSGRARFAEMTDQGGIIDANNQEIQC
ncbi:MAG: GspH/FimT family protein [Gammaproteobacteria bacterium]|nr:GspH/FimT family protein [Gammaproteobacteria bacterium]